MISGNGTGIIIDGSISTFGPTTGDVVAGNFIGTDISGTVALGNTGDGLLVQGGAYNDTIGGTTPGSGNVISGNLQNGVVISGSGTSGNLLDGNYIGTNATGTAALANGGGGLIVQNGANNNTIGGTDTNSSDAPLAGAGNVISGQAGFGDIGISILGSTGNRIQGNYIGTDVTGTFALGNSFGLVSSHPGTGSVRTD